MNHVSTWVSASAGTGKTKILTDRVLSLLLSGTPPHRILCLTYTNAAASEMQSRIYNELARWSRMNDEDLIKTVGIKNKSTARQLFYTMLDGLEKLKIETIHGFCQSLLRRFPLEADVIPHFRLIDENESYILMNEAEEQLFLSLGNRERIHPELHDSIETLVRILPDKTFSELLKELLKGYSHTKIMSLLEQHGARKLTAMVKEKLGLNDENEKDIEKEILSGIINLIPFMPELENGQITDKEIAAKLKEVKENPNLNLYLEIFLTDKLTPRSTLGTKKIPENIKNALRKEQERVYSLFGIIKKLKTLKRTNSLIHVMNAIHEIYESLKQSKAVLDFNDLIIKTERLLKKPDIAPWIMYKLDGGIDHILIDEAQDTSLEQWEIISKLCEEFFISNSARDNNRTIFVVGDEKQSIYSFQGASPKSFKLMKEKFSNYIAMQQRQLAEIMLDISYRSTEPILNAVDAIFSNPDIKKSISSLDKDIAHGVNRKLDGGRVELWPLVIADKLKLPQEPWPIPNVQQTNQDARTILANDIADTIYKWLKSERKIESKGRNIEPSDIMILLRTRSDFMDIIIRALRARDIPVSGTDRMKLMEHIAVQDLLALAEFILLPENDLNLAILLKTPLIAMDEELLFELCHNRGEETLWQILKKDASCEKIYNYLCEIIAIASSNPPYEFYKRVLDIMGGRSRFIGRMGYEVSEILDDYLSLALKYELQHPPFLQGFIAWFKSSDVEIKREQSGLQNVAQVMTVHGSKGLESPIVILPDTTRMPSYNQDYLCWEERRGGLFFLPSLMKYRDDYSNSLIENARLAANDEYYRLLYVALTRAEDELYILGASDNDNIKSESWYGVAETGLKNIAKKDQSGKYILSSIQENQVKERAGIEEEVIPPLPNFYLVDAPEAPKLNKRTASDFKIIYSKAAVIKGRIVHLLLEYLPNISEDKREDYARSYLEKFSSDINDKEEIISNVIAILKKFPHIFSKSSMAEVPISGSINGTIISGIIDRISITEDEIWLVDYKTGEVPDSTPLQYIKQMATYKTLLQNIYPNKIIKPALVWVAGPTLIEIPEHSLDILKNAS